MHPLYALLLFQMLMIIISATVVSRKNSVYYLAGLALEILVTWSVFEFSSRKPWDGREKKAEHVIEEVQDRLLESISSYHFESSHSRPRALRNHLAAGRLDPGNSQHKQFLLLNAYLDPNERLNRAEERLLPAFEE